MLKFINILVFILFAFVFQVAVSQELTKLQEAVEKASSDRERFFALMELADYQSYSDTLQALETLRSAFPLTQESAYLEGIYYFNEAGIYFNYDRFKSQKLYRKADDYLKWYTTPEAYRYRARLWHNYGALEQHSGREQNFLKVTLDNCIPFAEKSGDMDLLIGYFTDVGMIFANGKEYDKALEYYHKALSQVEKSDKKSEALLWTYLNMFDTYLVKTNEKSIANLYQETLKLWQHYPKSKLAGFVYRNEARYFSLVGKNKEALESIDKGIDFVLKNNIPWDYVALEYEKIRIYKLSERFQEAKQELEKLLENPVNQGVVGNKLNLINELAEVEAKLGDHKKSYELMVEHRNLRDSLVAQNDKRMIADMELQYRTAEKEKAILLLENQNKLNKIFLFGGIFIVLMLAAWFFYAWNVRRKRHKKDSQLRKQQQEIEVTHALMEGEQQERNRLAKELHDGLGGRITGIKMKAEMLAKTTSKTPELDKIIKQLDIAIVELRNTAHNLMPSALQKYGLQAAITDFCQSLQSDKQRIKLYTDGLEILNDRKWQLSVYRIVQELLTNAVKHSEASCILLQCTFKDGLLLIEIEDNGKGFDTKSVARNMGLNNIETRVSYLGGRMEILSEKGIGTTITIECKI